MKKESTKTKMVNDTLSSDRLIVSSNQSRTQEKKEFHYSGLHHISEYLDFLIAENQYLQQDASEEVSHDD